MKRSLLIFLFVLMAFVFAACSPQSLPSAETPVSSEPIPPVDEFPAAIEAARQALADQLGIPIEQVSVVGYNQVDWPDGCLGLGGPAELCLAAITPGYDVRLEAGGEQYAFRTDLDGSAIRPDLVATHSVAADMARLALAERLGITIAQITIVSQVPVDWPDGCLGLPAPDELCAMMIVPGFEVTLQVDDQQYIYRTNQDGSQVREAPALPASEAVRNMLAERTGVSPARIDLISEESVEWPDACLGVQLPDVMCAQVITPGYRFVFAVDGDEYVVHTDQSVNIFVLASAPVPGVQEALIVWEERDFGCSTVLVGTKALAYGTCGADLFPALLASFERVQEFEYLAEVFAPFEAETPAGKVVFRGRGQQEAGEAQQRAVAEWTRQVFLESREGQSDPAVGQVLEWHREGGFAGFCDTLLVDVSGFASAHGCFGDAKQGMVFLSAEQLEQMYEWRDQLMSVELEETDEAVADAMTIRLVFIGEGSRPASEQDQQAMMNMASEVFNQISRMP